MMASSVASTIPYLFFAFVHGPMSGVIPVSNMLWVHGFRTGFGAAARFAACAMDAA